MLTRHFVFPIAVAGLQFLTLACSVVENPGSEKGGTSSQTTVAKTVVRRLVAKGLGFTVFIQDRKVFSLGDNRAGVLGFNDTVDRPVRSLVSLPGAIVPQSVVAGGGTTCLLDEGGDVRCWGQNSYGNLGIGTASTTPTLTPQKKVMGLGKAEDLAYGDIHACAIHSGGALACWGSNDFGQLGIGTLGGMSTQAAPVIASGVTDVAAGRLHTCAVVNASVNCWGGNSYGQLGTGDTVDAIVPVAVPGTEGATAVATGAFHTCAVVKGAVKCWGGAAFGVLGIGAPGSTSSIPSPVTTIAEGASAISAGVFSTCAVVHDRLQCWGYNTDGQLGLNTFQNVDVPTPATFAVNGITSLAVKGDSSCVFAGGAPYCTGKNFLQTGIENTKVFTLIP